MQAIRIVVPATSANLGPGFDCLGLALGLYNEVILECGGERGRLPPRPAHVPHLEVLGEGAASLSRGTSNLLLQAFRHGIHALRSSTPPLPRITQVNRIPLARGLGSSAAAIVAGLAAACALAGAPLDRDWILQHATHLEGHPDNVAPAIFGGLTVAFSEDLPTAGEAPRARCLSLPVAGLSVALAVPDFTVSTEDARACIPGQFPLQDVVFTASRTALLSGALILGRHDLLRKPPGTASTRPTGHPSCAPGPRWRRQPWKPGPWPSSSAAPAPPWEPSWPAVPWQPNPWPVAWVRPSTTEGARRAPWRAPSTTRA